LQAGRTPQYLALVPAMTLASDRALPGATCIPIREAHSMTDSNLPPQGPAGGQPQQPYTPAAPGAPLSPTEDKQWASFAHFGGILSFLPPLIIWLIFKDRGTLTNQEGKEALNFQLTLAIAQVANFVVGVILSFATLGLWAIVQSLIATAIWIVGVVFAIIAGVRVSGGGTYRYPFALRLVK
jgi:hypothetical protein